MASDPRHAPRQAFLDRHLGPSSWRLLPASADASFRRYFRIETATGTWMLMDAPPAQEDCRPFLDVAERLRRAGLRAPRIQAQDLSHGFLLLEDFGDVLYRERIDRDSIQPWFELALESLVRLARSVDPAGLPPYDSALLQQELDLFTDWYLDGQLGRPLSHAERSDWDRLCQDLIHRAHAQPQVFVHRDFHSCNLMDVDGGPPGLIDFQDAVHGPLTYDLVSFLLDRYWTWPREVLEHWVERFRRQVAPEADAAAFQSDCDAMGLQRNLKVVGIFARLDQRDGKPHYRDLQPRFLGHIRDVLPRDPAFAALAEILDLRPCAH